MKIKIHEMRMRLRLSNGLFLHLGLHIPCPCHSPKLHFVIDETTFSSIVNLQQYFRRHKAKPCSNFCLIGLLFIQLCDHDTSAFANACLLAFATHAVGAACASDELEPAQFLFLKQRPCTTLSNRH